MNLLGHVDPDMTMRYMDVTLTDLQREIQSARSKPRHLAPQPKSPLSSGGTGRSGVIGALVAAQRVLELFGRTLPGGSPHVSLARLSNRLNRNQRRAQAPRGHISLGQRLAAKARDPAGADHKEDGRLPQGSNRL
jgi:hypothetical protein